MNRDEDRRRGARRDPYDERGSGRSGRRDYDYSQGGFFPGGSERDYEEYRTHSGRGSQDYDRGEDRYVSGRNYDRGVSYRGGDYGGNDFDYARRRPDRHSGREDDDRHRWEGRDFDYGPGVHGRGEYRRDFDRGLDRSTGSRGFDRDRNFGYERIEDEGDFGGGHRPYGQRYGTQGYGSADHNYGGREQGYSSRSDDYGAGRYGLGEHAGRGPEGYQRSKERIYEDVCERLARHPHLDATSIRVVVDSSEITLEGTVDSRWAKRTAEDIAESVEGVQDVHNRLRISQEQDGASGQRQSSGQTAGQQTSGQQGGRSTTSRGGAGGGSTARSGSAGSGSTAKKGASSSGADTENESGSAPS